MQGGEVHNRQVYNSIPQFFMICGNKDTLFEVQGMQQGKIWITYIETIRKVLWINTVPK